MKKYIYLAFTIICLIFIYDVLFNPAEVVGIQSAIYNEETGKITFQVSHNIGCGSYYNYEYNLVEKDFYKKEAVFYIALKTDNRCEGFALNNDLEIELPNLPFKPSKLIFKGGVSDVIVTIP